MTAVSTPPGQVPNTRERLVHLLAGLVVRADSTGAIDIQEAERLADDALLPEVAALVREGAAEALDALDKIAAWSGAMAAALGGIGVREYAEQAAAALRAPASRGEGQ